MLSIEQLIWKQASLNPNKIAIISGKEQATYSELQMRIVAAKRLLQQLSNYQNGASVIISASKEIGFNYAYFGAHLAELIVVPVDPEINNTRLQYIINTVKPICLIGFDKYETEITKYSIKDFDKLEGIYEKVEFPDLNKTADILFTSGTTGNPKGVSLSFENESAAANNINTYIGNNSDDVELLALPISHSFGLGRIRCCLSIGATLILLGSFVNVKRIFRLIEEYKVTGFTMVPSSWKFLQKLSGDDLSKYASQLHYIEMGSAYLSKEDKTHLANLFPKTRLTMHYGLTEASRSAFMEFHEDSEALDSVGKASPNTDIKIFNEQGDIITNGEEGEICICGKHVTKGYINISNDMCFFGNYFRTGDWGIIDKNGYIYLKSRKKELINVGGKKVSPIEVEEVLKSIPGIIDCACVPIPDPKGILGEVVKAYIVVDTEKKLEEIFIKDEILKSHLELYKQPVVYEFISEIPRTQNGKILRTSLV